MDSGKTLSHPHGISFTEDKEVDVQALSKDRNYRSYRTYRRHRCLDCTEARNSMMRKHHSYTEDRKYYLRIGIGRSVE